MQRSPGCHPEGMTDPSVHGGATELGRFVRARRAQVTPGQVGLPAAQGRRRTTGLRREELATQKVGSVRARKGSEDGDLIVADRESRSFSALPSSGAARR